MSCKKFLGLDFGEKTIGVAVSHNGRVASGVKTLHRKDPDALRPCLKELKIILREYEIKNIVLGFPKNMNGEDSTRCAETLAFKEKLLRYFKNVNVILWDERLSTLAVSRVFEGKRKNYKKNVDKMAAVYILQGYLDYQNGKEGFVLQDDFEELYDDDELYIEDENGKRVPVSIVASKENDDGIFLLALTEDDEAVLFSCVPSEKDPEEVILEIVDNEHENFENIFALFKDDIEAFDFDISDEGEL